MLSSCNTVHPAQREVPFLVSLREGLCVQARLETRESAELRESSTITDPMFLVYSTLLSFQNHIYKSHSSFKFVLK